MAAPRYHIQTRWQIEGAVEELSLILRDAASFPKWWKPVFLDVRIVRPGNERGIGEVAEVRTRGLFPYVLHWRLTVVESHSSYGFAVETAGDLCGRGVWRLRPRGSQVEVTFDWGVTANHWLVRRLSWLLKPLFGMNHRWAMARGRDALAAELARRKAVGRLRPGPASPAVV
jgi:hypothetical protein